MYLSYLQIHLERQHTRRACRRAAAYLELRGCAAAGVPETQSPRGQQSPQPRVIGPRSSSSALPRPLICRHNHFQVVGVFTRRRPKPPKWPAPSEVAVRDLPLPPKTNNHLACRWHHQPARPSWEHAHTHGSGQDMRIMWRDRRLHIRSPLPPHVKPGAYRARRHAGVPVVQLNSSGLAKVGGSQRGHC